MIAYISQHLLIMYYVLRSFYCNKNIFLSQYPKEENKNKNVQFSAHISITAYYTFMSSSIGNSILAGTYKTREKS